MSAIIPLIVIGGAALAFFGLGGGDAVSGLFDRTKENKENRPKNENTPGNERKSTVDAERNSNPELESVKQKETRDRIRKTNDTTIIETPESIKRARDDVLNLNQRKATKTREVQRLKQSGATIVKQKRAQEQKAFGTLRKSGSTFLGTGKLGRSKLNANPNFNLGLPSTATQADRDRVIKRQEQRKEQQQKSIDTRKNSNEKLIRTREFNKRVAELKNRNLSKRAEDRLLSNLKRSFGF